MEPLGVKRRLTCILAADAVGYSRMMGADEAGTVRVLAAHRAVIDGIIAFHNGRIVGTAGDSVLAEFGSAVEAVRCAVEIQDALKTRNDALPEDSRLLFRVGVNLGDVVVKGDDLLGDGVNVAARLEGIAPAGGICIASSVYDQITGKLDLGFVDIGEQSLKNISRPVRVYRVAGAGAPARAKPAAAGAGPRRAIWAGAGVVAVAAAVLGAWQAGWLDRGARSDAGGGSAGAMGERAPAQVGVSGQRPVSLEQAPRPSAPDDAQRQAAVEQAERAAAEAQRHAAAEAELTRAKAEAEAAAVRARAEAAAARAKGEADALRAKAELDAASLRAKAEADAAAARARSEAEQARREADAKAAAPATAPVAAVASAAGPGGTPAATVSLAGKWMVARSCAAFEELPVWTETPFPLTVQGDSVTLEHGQPGQPGYMLLSGRVYDDGRLVLTGTGVAGSKRNYGGQLKVRFSGRVAPERFSLPGRYGARDCTLNFVAARG